MSAAILEKIDSLYAAKGDERYGEGVTQLEHALQSALLAETEHAPEMLVVAALLHDIGHMLHPDAEAAAARGVSDRHEQVGAGWLTTGGFPAAVAEPIRLHVDAKRYLCQIDPTYHDGLSQASKLSLAAQGGVFDAAEAEGFIGQAFAQEAVRLRRWDEAAKIPAKATPAWTHYRDLVAGAFRAA